MADDDAKREGKRPKYDLPTKDEQRNLQQVEAVLRTNLIQLQASELLSQVKPGKHFESRSIVEWIDQLKKDLQSDGLNGLDLSQAWLHEHGLTGLQLSKHASDSVNFTFQRPASVEIIGSHASATATAPLLNIDIALTLPAEIFTSRDIMNHVYFDKRRLYLAGVVALLNKSVVKSSKKTKQQSSSSSVDYALSVSHLKGDSRKPILHIVPPFNSVVVIRVIPVIPSSVFRLVQLRAAKNNVRPAYWNKMVKLNKKAGKKDSELDPSLLPATPHYNYSILEDMALLTHHRIIMKTVGAAESTREALVLFKVWLTQRSMRFGPDSFDGHCAAMLLAYLVQTRRVSAHSTPLGIFQTLLTFLSETDLTSHSLDFTSTEVTPSPSNATSLSAAGAIVGSLFHPIVSSTPDGGSDSIYFNCLWRVSLSALRHLHQEAAKSLLDLQTAQEYCFDSLFMQPRTFYASHDAFYHIPINSEAIESHVLKNKSLSLAAPDAQQQEEEEVDREVDVSLEIERGLHSALLSQNSHSYLAAKVVSVISQALGDRVVAVHSFVRSAFNSSSSSTSSSSSSSSNAHQPVMSVTHSLEDSSQGEWVVSVGLLLNKEKQYRKVDRAPTVDEASEELRQFRRFWGDKAQLRRFQDGAICDSVVWEPTSEASVIDLIVRYALGRHVYCVCGESGENVMEVTNQLERSYLHTSGHIPCSSKGAAAAKEGPSAASEDATRLTRTAVEAVDSLRSILTSQIKNIPLGFDSLLGVTPELRYTAVYPARTQPLLTRLSSSEGGGKELKEWLKDLAGQTVSLLTPPLRVIGRLESSGKWPVDGEAIKKAKTAMLLRTRSELMKQFSIQSVVHRDSLDIMYRGYLFRLVLAASHETEVLTMINKEEQQQQGEEGEEARDHLLMDVLSSHEVLPLHHSSIRALHSVHPSYSAAVRLLSVWASNHFFSGHLSHEAMELIVAAEYLQPSTLLPPASALAGFSRALLRLANHSWETDPLIVDLSLEGSVITSSDKVEIISRFRNSRALVANAHSSGKRVTPREETASAPMVIVSSSDKVLGYHSSLASRSPEKVVLHLIVQAAKSSAAKLLKWVECVDSMSSSKLDATLHDVMYSNTVMSNCNAVLHFNSSLLNSQDTKKGPSFARLSLFSNTSPSEVTVNNLIVSESYFTSHPVQAGIIDKLRSSFSNEAIFLWNGLHGKEVGIIWRPKSFLPKKFAILNCKHRAAVTTDTNETASVGNSSAGHWTVPNVDELLSDIIRTSEGLIVNSHIV